MIAHQAKREQIDRVFVESLPQRTKEHLEVFRLVENILLLPRQFQ